MVRFAFRCDMYCPVKVDSHQIKLSTVSTYYTAVTQFHKLADMYTLLTDDFHIQNHIFSAMLSKNA